MASLLDILNSLGRFTGLGAQGTLGAAGVLGGSLLDREPGEVGEARQALRNLATSPYGDLAIPEARTGASFLTGQVNAPADPFAAGGAYEKHLPVLQRNEADVLKGLAHRYSAGLAPSISGMAGSEVAATRRAGNELLQTRNALAADLMREQQTRQTSSAQSLLNYGQGALDLRRGAAGDLLEFSRPDPLAGSIANLGSLLLMDKLMGGQGGAAGQGGGVLDSLLRGGQGTPQGGLGGALQSLLGGVGGGAGANLGQTIASLIQGGANTGLKGFLWQLPGGQQVEVNTVEAQALANAGIGQPVTGAAAAGGGLMSLLGPLAAGAGGFLGGGATGAAIGQNQAQAAGAGAASGAAIGGLIGSLLPAITGPVGAVIGGLSGLLGGFTKERAQQHALKAQRHAADLQAAGGNQRAVGSFWVQALASAGYENLDGFRADVDRITQSINDAGSDVFLGITRSSTGLTEGELIAQQASQLLRQLTGKADLDEIPGFRDQYISYLLSNYKIESGGGVSPATSVGQFGSYLDTAGISR